MGLFQSARNALHSFRAQKMFWSRNLCSFVLLPLVAMETKPLIILGPMKGSIIYSLPCQCLCSPMGSYGVLWSPMGSFGMLWMMESYGVLWDPMESYGVRDWVLIGPGPMEGDPDHTNPLSPLYQGWESLTSSLSSCPICNRH